MNTPTPPIDAAAIQRAEEDIQAALAAASAAEKSTATAAAAAETDDQKIDRVLAEMESIKKSIAAVGQRGPNDDDDDDGNGDDDDDEDGNDASKSTFLRQSLETLGAEGRDQKQTAMDVSRWLDGMAEVVKSIRTSQQAELRAVRDQLTVQGRQLGLLLQLSAVQAKKSVATATAAAAAPVGRASQLTVLQSDAVDASKIPPPRELKNLALKALSAGRINQNQVGLIETCINGTGPVELGGSPPSLPPPHLLSILLDMQTAA